jgi:prepilin signal peptidase PulO-like enzyme (type II secretory pathway)
MSKKTNTLWFILGATAFNILITVVCFILLLVVFIKFITPYLPESAAAWGFPIIFVGAIVLSFVLYRIILKQLMKKIDFEKYFDPIFGRRRK